MLHKTTRTLLPLTRNTLDPTTIIRSIFSSIFISEFYLFLSFFLFLLHFSPPLFYNNSTLKYRESRRATRNNRRVSRTLCRLIERDKRSKMASNQTSTEYGSCVSRVGWREREEEGDRERKRERGGSRAKGTVLVSVALTFHNTRLMPLTPPFATPGRNLCRRGTAC